MAGSGNVDDYIFTELIQQRSQNAKYFEK